MPRWLLALGWGAVACRGTPESDPQRYLQAVGEADPAACLAIGDADLQAECRAFATWELARQGRPEEAEAACGEMPAGPWRDECWFQLSDLLAAEGDRAKALCAEAGSWRDHCVAHAMGREAQAMLAASALGEEARVFPEVEALARAYVGPRKGPARARGILRKALAARTPPGADFDVATCGTAPASLCRDAYAQVVAEAAGLAEPERAGAEVDALGRVCAAGPSLESVRAQGLPAWTPGSESVALEAWTLLCTRGRGGGLIPGQAPRLPGHNAPPDVPR